MARGFDAASRAFRSEFVIPTKDLLRWFPGHMAKSMMVMQQKLRGVDCVIEVHDARIPVSGRNPRFQKTLSGIKPHILVLNKKDLSDPSLIPFVRKHYESERIPIVYTNCKDQMDRGVKQLMPLVLDMVASSERYNRSDSREFVGMIIGVPNVGKSSLINMLRHKYMKKGSASPVGGVAGITRGVLNRIKISTDPLFYMLDTPGILEPMVQDVDMGIKLALCACLPDHLVGETIIADYLLFWLNKYSKFQYVDLMGLQEPTDDITEVLTSGALMLNKSRKLRTFDNERAMVPDLHYAALHMIRAFRNGELGKLFLDRNLIIKDSSKLKEGPAEEQL